MGPLQKLNTPFYIVVQLDPGASPPRTGRALGSLQLRLLLLPIQLLEHLACERGLASVRIGRGDVLEGSPCGVDLFEIPEGKALLVIRLGNRVPFRVVADGEV